MTTIKMTDLAAGAEPGLAPSILSLKFKESRIADNAIYDAVELAYRTEQSLDVEQDVVDGGLEVTSYNVKLRQVSEGIITFTLEDTEYSLSPSDT